MTNAPTVESGEPVAVLQKCLNRLERAAIARGEHPVIVHTALTALDRLERRIRELRERVAEALYYEHDAKRHSEKLEEGMKEAIATGDLPPHIAAGMAEILDKKEPSA